MEEVDSVPRRVVGLDLDRLTGSQPHHVLEALALVGVDLVSAAVGAREDAEVDQVDVDRVAPAAAAVLQLPQLDGAARTLARTRFSTSLKATPLIFHSPLVR